MRLSTGTVCRRKLLLFLLAGILLCLLRFLSHVTLRDPKVGSMQVKLDMHKFRVHHNRKIDTACFEHGKQRSHRSALWRPNLSHDTVDVMRGRRIFPTFDFGSASKKRTAEARCPAENHPRRD
jgi:hypothetical protein